MTYWDAVQAGMMDELEKIAEIDLSGLSPRTVIEKGQPAPVLQTAGLEKAFRVLDRYESEKTAAPRIPFNPDLPQVNRVAGKKKKKKDDQSATDRAKSLAGHVAGGAGIGRLAGYAAIGPRAPVTDAAKQLAHKKMWGGMMVGAGLGATEFARKRIAERMAAKKEEKTAAVTTTPAMRLKATQQVARHATRTTGPVSGPSKITSTALRGIL